MIHWGMQLTKAMRNSNFNKSIVIAYELGVDESTISRWKHGGHISMVHAIKLCTVLNVSLDWMFLTKSQGENAIDEMNQSITQEFENKISKLPLTAKKSFLDFLNAICL